MIRFQRIGRRNDPAFRILVLEKTASPKAGTYVDQVGTYNPRTKDFSADGEKIKGWIGKGAQVSPSLKNLLIDKGILEGKKVQVISKTNLEKNVKKEEPAAPEAAPEVTDAPGAETPAAEVAGDVTEAAVAAEAVEEVAGGPAKEEAAA